MCALVRSRPFGPRMRPPSRHTPVNANKRWLRPLLCPSTMAPASKRLREEPVYAPVQRKGCFDGFVYIMYEREFLARGDELYKVGMSELGEETRRMQHGYTGGSQLIACAAVSDARVVETRIKEAFAEQFARFRNLGTERFSGDLRAMKRLFDVLVEPDLLGPWAFIPQAPPSMKAPGPPVSRETVSEDAVSDAVCPSPWCPPGISNMLVPLRSCATVSARPSGVTSLSRASRKCCAGQGSGTERKLCPEPVNQLPCTSGTSPRAVATYSCCPTFAPPHAQTGARSLGTSRPSPS